MTDLNFVLLHLRTSLATDRRSIAEVSTLNHNRQTTRQHIWPTIISSIVTNKPMCYDELLPVGFTHGYSRCSLSGNPEIPCRRPNPCSTSWSHELQPTSTQKTSILRTKTLIVDIDGSVLWRTVHGGYCTASLLSFGSVVVRVVEWLYWVAQLVHPAPYVLTLPSAFCSVSLSRVLYSGCGWQGNGPFAGRP